MAHEETTRRLLAAIETLGAATRDVVWRRFFEGQPPREIAAARSEPLATVKSRLQRGIEELRVRLGEDGRGEWRAAFTSAFGIGKPGAAASALAGGVLMATWAKMAGAAAVAALVFAVWWPGRDVPTPIGGSDPLSAAPSLASSASLLADSTAATPAIPRAASAGPAIEREAPLVAATTSVSGRCVDEQGVPVAGCLVALSLSTPGSGSGSAALGLTAEPRVDPPAQRTGTDGSFRFDFSTSRTMDSSLSCATEGRVTAVLEQSLTPGQALAYADIVLRRGVSVRGRVVDRKGLPVAGVQFDARSREPADAAGHGRYRAAVTDRDGRFVFDGVLLPGVYAPRLGSGCTVREPDRIELSLARPVEDVVVVADVPIGIRGRVLDESGAPVRATVHIERAGPAGHSRGREANSLRDGTFFLPRPTDEDRPSVTLRVIAAGHETGVGGPIEWGTDDVEFRLQRAKGLVVEVVDRDGSPVTDYEVECVPCGAVAGPASRVAGPRGPFAGGVATLGAVTSGRWFVCVYFASLPSLSFREIVDVPREAHRVVLTRDRVDTRVRVVDGDGRPMVGSDVQWCELFGETFETKKVLVGAEVWRRNVGTKLGIVVTEGKTDAHGEFVAPLQRGSRFGLRVNGIRHVPWSQDFVVADERDVVVTVQRGARLVGRLLPPNALTLLRRYVSDQTPDLPPEAFGVRAAAAGAGRPSLRPIEAAEDGTYVVEGLAAGTCRLEFEWPVTIATKDSSSTRPLRRDLGIVTLSNQQEARLDIDLRGVLPGELEANVLRNGLPFADQRCQLIGLTASLAATRSVPPDGVEHAPSRPIGTDESGGFRVLLPPGRYCCGLFPAEGRRIGRDRWSREGVIRAQEVVTVEPSGVAKATFTFSIGSLDVQVVDANGAPVRGATVQLRRGEEWLPLPATESDGHTIVDLAPGSYPLRATRSSEPASATDWISAGDVVITVANVTKSSIRLAASASK